MEKLTISRVGQTKDIQTKYGMKKKTGVQFKEYGEIWHDIWSGDLKVGQVVEGTRGSREYEGKTYWDFKFPKKDEKTAGELSLMKTQIGSLNARLVTVEEKLGIRPATQPTAPAPEPSGDNGIEYPDEQINAEDIPF